MEYCAKSEKHPPWRIGDAQGVNAPFVRHPLSTEAAEKTHAKTQSRKEKRDSVPRVSQAQSRGRGAIISPL